MTTIPTFGDNVRIHSTSETERLGVAGLVGNVRGITTPSVTGVDVVGEIHGDIALNVFFEDRRTGLWLAPQLVEYVDCDAGAEIRLKGVEKRWVRAETGEWIEASDPKAEVRKPCWKFR